MRITTRLTFFFALILALTPLVHADYIYFTLNVSITGFSVQSQGSALYECNFCLGPTSMTGEHAIDDGGAGTVARKTFGPMQSEYVYLNQYSGTLTAGTIYEHCYRARIDATGSRGYSNGSGSNQVCAPALPQATPTPPKNCSPYWDVEGQTWVDRECDTPILLDLGVGGYRLTSAIDGVRFDIRGDGLPRQVAWTAPHSETAFLVLDRNGNGRIDSGAELFGSATPLASGSPAVHGFEALTELDGNADGVLDRNDAVWASLLLWTDRDHDGASGPGELQPIARSGVEWLASSSADNVNRRDAWGNVFRYMARFGSVTPSGNRTRQLPFYDVLLTSVAADN